MSIGPLSQRTLKLVSHSPTLLGRTGWMFMRGVLLSMSFVTYGEFREGDRPFGPQLSLCYCRMCYSGREFQSAYLSFISSHSIIRIPAFMLRAILLIQWAFVALLFIVQ